jgi:glucose-6-phosphate dehydrogenase assembly protein OpcA
METSLMVSDQIVSPEKIESKLSEIWQSLEGTSKMRASLFNLIICTQKNERTQYIHKVAETVIEKFPCRVILIAVDKTAQTAPLLVKVSVISPEKEQSDVACDFIEIAAAAADEVRIPSLILPHLLTDLPIYLVYAEDPTQENKIAQQLEMLASRLIFDSESTSNLPSFAKAVLAHQARSGADIADLNWARLESFRDALSAAFYPAGRIESLKQIKSIKMTYNSKGTPFFCHTKIQAVYLQAWLAAQLGWTFQEIKQNSDTLQFLYKEGIDVTLSPLSQEKMPPGAILNVEIFTHDQCHFSFIRSVDFPQRITFTYSTPSLCELPCHFIFARGEAGGSLVKEICHKGTSTHYLKVLNLIVKMGEGSPLC